MSKTTHRLQQLCIELLLHTQGALSKRLVMVSYVDKMARGYGGYLHCILAVRVSKHCRFKGGEDSDLEQGQHGW